MDVKNWIIYYENDGRIAYHDFGGKETQVQNLIKNNPGLVYMEGRCSSKGCKVNVSVTPHVVEHNVVGIVPPMHYIREKRNIFLKQCDWTIGPDSPLSDSKKAEWQAYRQALRDIPANNPDATDKNNIVWPTPPA